MDALLPSLSALSLNIEGRKRDANDVTEERRSRRVLRSDAEAKRQEQRSLLINLDDDEVVVDYTPAFVQCLVSNYGDTEEDEEDTLELRDRRTALRNAVATHTELRDPESFETMYTALVEFTVSELELSVQRAVDPMVDYGVDIAGDVANDEVVQQNAMSAPTLSFKLILEQRKDKPPTIEAYGLNQKRTWVIEASEAEETKREIVRFLVDAGAIPTREAFLDVKAAFAVRLLNDAKK